jgi:uncharacterized protein YndB with AHSA1/START domain
MKESIVFDTFAIERTYKASPARVFDAWQDPAKKRRWFVEGEGFVIDSYELDFRELGFERTRFRHGGGPAMTCETVFHDIVPNARIVASYGMTLDGKRFSVSLSTLVLEAHGTGTRVRYTEQGAYFEGAGPEAASGRREGCVEMLEKLAKEVDPS